MAPGTASDTAEATALRKGMSAPLRCSATALPAVNEGATAMTTSLEGLLLVLSDSKLG